MSQKTAIVTGSTGGIGEAICQSLFDEGIEVIGLCHSQGNNTPWKNHVCDLSNLYDLEGKLEEVYKSIEGSINILVNNAGVYHAKPWDEISISDFEKAINVNTTAPFILTRFWANKLIESKNAGVCVNVSSISGHLGSVDVSYATSKAGLNLVTKTMAKALAANNIRVNGIAPGPIKTKMADKIPADRLEKYKEGIPMQRFGEVNEIVSLVQFLLSDKSSFMTGETVNIDGGLS